MMFCCFFPPPYFEHSFARSSGELSCAPSQRLCSSPRARVPPATLHASSVVTFFLAPRDTRLLGPPPLTSTHGPTPLLPTPPFLPPPPLSSSQDGSHVTPSAGTPRHSGLRTAIPPRLHYSHFFSSYPPTLHRSSIRDPRFHLPLPQKNAHAQLPITNAPPP